MDKKSTEVETKAEATTNNVQSYTEAPASVTYSVTSPNGYGLLFTARAENIGELTDLIGPIEAHFKQHGYKPQIRGTYARKQTQPKGYVNAKSTTVYRPEPCPKCKGRVAVKQIKLRDGTTKTLHECENRHYDFRTKHNSGTCDYFEWK